MNIDYWLKHSSSTVRAKFFSKRIVNVWNNLPDIVDFSTLTSYIRTVKNVDLSEHLRYYTDRRPVWGEDSCGPKALC